MSDMRSPSTDFIKRLVFIAALVACAFWLLARPQIRTTKAQTLPPNYKNFESPQVHPLAVTPDGARLLAVNSPNGTLSVFHLTGSGLTLMAEIPVGLEPTSVRARNDREAWVTNWLSDSVSVVDLKTFNVTRTFDVGDEPTDIIFAGQQRELAFVCVSGLSQIKVYDPSSPATAPQLINIRGKQPRSLSRDAAGAQVFVSVFESGNGTTIVPAASVSAAGGPPAPIPAKAANLPAAPNVGLIVKWNGAGWADERGDTRWNQFIPYTLADNDVVALDARTAAPVISAQVRGVGTHIGNSVLDSSTNKLYVVNLEAHNETRFEPNLSGRFLTTRVSIINFDSGASISAVDLNSHINYSARSGSDAERALSLSSPADIARGSDGALYVAATGSGKVGVLDESGAVVSRINVGQGPTGLALHPRRKLLYVLNRFDETLSIVDLNTKTETGQVAIGFNPEPQSVRAGRRFLYDGQFSAHGDLSCASCHLNGHRDGVAWDLGDPQGQMQQVTSPFPSPLLQQSSNFHPMKGPMTTQSLRGLTATEPLHWRGDRSGIASFNPAFTSLLGGPRQLTPQEMAAFDAFVRTLAYPPNPLQNLDRTLPNPASGPNAARGAQLFNNARLDGNILTCNQCHTTFPGTGAGTDRAIIQAALLQESQDFKVPQLRGLYQKTGMRRIAGEQDAGYGFAHDGSFDTLFSFLRSAVFTFQSDNDRRDVEQFVLAFDTGIAPAVGLQLTVNNDNKTAADTVARLNLLIAQANTGNCDLIARGKLGGASRSFLHTGGGSFQPDRQAEAALSSQALLQSVTAGAELTFTGVPFGAGRRFALDHDGNGTLDGDEPSRTNAIDSSRLFVWQHYVDFLNREPDSGGLDYWTNEIDSCPTQPLCLGQRRNGVSAAFFVENEFQQTGYFVYRLYKATFGRQPTFGEFGPDRSRVVDGPNLEANKQALVNDWVARTAFTAAAAYPVTMTNTEFVNKLYDTAGLSPYTAERQQQIDAMTLAGRTRAQVLRDVIETAELVNREYNPAFVRMQYFGYLQRNPDPGGEAFWLDVVNNRVANNYRAMVCAFITSTEYQQRFGLNITRSNADCANP
jgi:YVTN family beta-propeller protein